MLLDENRFEIHINEMEKTHDSYSKNWTGSRYWEEYCTQWEGTLTIVDNLKEKSFEVKFMFENSGHSENGGSGIQKFTGKPRHLSDEEWNELHDLVGEFLEEDYRENRMEWEED